MISITQRQKFRESGFKYSSKLGLIKIIEI